MLLVYAHFANYHFYVCIHILFHFLFALSASCCLCSYHSIINPIHNLSIFLHHLPPPLSQSLRYLQLPSISLSFSLSSSKSFNSSLQNILLWFFFSSQSGFPSQLSYSYCRDYFSTLLHISLSTPYYRIYLTPFFTISFTLGPSRPSQRSHIPIAISFCIIPYFTFPLYCMGIMANG